MPLGSHRRGSLLRAAGVVVITTSVTLGAACSDEDTVDTIPPPRPNSTMTLQGPQGVPAPSSTTVITTSTSTTGTSTTRTTAGTTSGRRTTHTTTTPRTTR